MLPDNKRNDRWKRIPPKAKFWLMKKMLKVWGRSKYKPHNGLKECARRIRQSPMGYHSGKRVLNPS